MSSCGAYSGSGGMFRDPLQCQVLGAKFLILGLNSLNKYFKSVIIYLFFIRSIRAHGPQELRG